MDNPRMPASQLAPRRPSSIGSPVLGSMRRKVSFTAFASTTPTQSHRATPDTKRTFRCDFPILPNIGFACCFCTLTLKSTLTCDSDNQQQQSTRKGSGKEKFVYPSGQAGTSAASGVATNVSPAGFLRLKKSFQPFEFNRLCMFWGRV